jgi:hypothetical protein
VGETVWLVRAPLDLESQGVAVIAEDISAMFARQSLASPRPGLLLTLT